MFKVYTEIPKHLPKHQGYEGKRKRVDLFRIGQPLVAQQAILRLPFGSPDIHSRGVRERLSAHVLFYGNLAVGAVREPAQHGEETIAIRTSQQDLTLPTAPIPVACTLPNLPPQLASFFLFYQGPLVIYN